MMKSPSSKLNFYLLHLRNSTDLCENCFAQSHGKTPPTRLFRLTGWNFCQTGRSRSSTRSTREDVKTLPVACNHFCSKSAPPPTPDFLTAPIISSRLYPEVNALQLDTSVSHSANGFRRPRSICSQAVRFKSSPTNRAPFGGRWWRSDARRRCRSLSDFLLTAPPLGGPWCVGCLIDVIKSVAICGNNVANCSRVQK